MLALANKYRPSTFEDVVGQENIIHILKNQVESETTAKAYLFTGGAGTGKTTTARILARSVNGSSKNIIEIDGASNNGVDNVRELIEVVQYKPLDSKYKIIIIDEVHMLSTGAFNALLKTLEEPPEHAIFILATTDPQKIPATILSRLQRFDFKRMTVEQIVQRLNYILLQEDYSINLPSEERNVSDAAVEYIAKLAQGGMRNAISLLDTCLGYKQNLDESDIAEILGVSSYEDYINMLQAIIDKDRKIRLDILDKNHYNGKDLKVFLKGFTEFMVDYMKYRIMGDLKHTSIPDLYKEALDRLPSFQLIELYERVAELNYRVKYETAPKSMIEGGFLAL